MSGGVYETESFTARVLSPAAFGPQDASVIHANNRSRQASFGAGEFFAEDVVLSMFNVLPENTTNIDSKYKGSKWNRIYRLIKSKKTDLIFNYRKSVRGCKKKCQIILLKQTNLF